MPVKRDSSDSPSSATADTTHYEVGYGKPPKATRFKPGQSGNRSGRRTRSPDFRKMLEDVYKRPVTLRSGNKEQKLPVYQILHRKMIDLAFKGDKQRMTQRSKLSLLRQTHQEAPPPRMAAPPLPISVRDRINPCNMLTTFVISLVASNNMDAVCAAPYVANLTRCNCWACAALATTALRLHRAHCLQRPSCYGFLFPIRRLPNERLRCVRCGKTFLHTHL
jgi:hypothetical protein